jgi:pimeloyl-ACP methyl ester carboxylesterase
VRPDPEVRRTLLLRFFRSQDDRISAIIPFIYDSHTPRERIATDVAVVKQHQPPMRGQLTQFAAILRWTCWGRLPSITAPTLVIHGETDRLVPPENSRIIANRIPGAKLVILPRASHIFPTDQPELTKKEILDFLLGPA